MNRNLAQRNCPSCHSGLVEPRALLCWLCFLRNMVDLNTRNTAA